MITFTFSTLCLFTSGHRYGPIWALTDPYDIILLLHELYVVFYIVDFKTFFSKTTLAAGASTPAHFVQNQFNTVLLLIFQLFTKSTPAADASSPAKNVPKHDNKSMFVDFVWISSPHGWSQLIEVFSTYMKVSNTHKLYIYTCGEDMN